MKGPLSLLKNTVTILKDYCLNCSLAGVRYIADDRYHPVERLFWLICVTISSLGSYSLIMEFRESLESTAISMVSEEKDLWERIQFPSVGVCEMGSSKEEYPRLADIIWGLIGNRSLRYDFDVEEFLLRVVFQNVYSPGSLHPYCSGCDGCTQCPTEGYLEIADISRSNCSELFKTCTWREKQFDCCQYFLPIKTTVGLCFLLNSIQTTQRDSINWLPTEYGDEDLLVARPMMKLIMHKPTATFILNEEDIPHMLLPKLQFQQELMGSNEFIMLNIQGVDNDPSVRKFSPEYRRCLFPNEQNEQSPYKYYSFSVCATDCIRAAQIRYCNCTHHNFIYTREDRNLSCDFEGLLCLDRNELFSPQTSILQPWHTGRLVCDCLPSCTEKEISVAQQTPSENSNGDDRTLTIAIHDMSRRYRRQVVRSNLDLVVTVGGILGLISGASILSAVELFYFFTVRLIGSFYVRRRQTRRLNLQKQSERMGQHRRRPRWSPNEQLTRYESSLKSGKVP